MHYLIECAAEEHCGIGQYWWDLPAEKAQEEKEEKEQKQYEGGSGWG